MNLNKRKNGIKVGLRKLVAPIFIETLLIMMLGAVDTVMLSQYSDEAVAAVGVVNQLVMFAFLIFEIINMGTSVLCSQYLGAKLPQKMVQVVGVSLLLNILIGLGVSAGRVDDLWGELYGDCGGFCFLPSHFAYHFSLVEKCRQGHLSHDGGRGGQCVEHYR